MRVGLIRLMLFCVVSAACSSTKTPPAGPGQNVQQTSSLTSSPSASESQSSGSTRTTVRPPTVNACALLTESEIELVQGEKVKDTKLSGQIAGGLSISQCFFTLPTFNKSISLIVAHKGDGLGARDPKEFWQTTFHANEREKKRDIEEEESQPPRGFPTSVTKLFGWAIESPGRSMFLKGTHTSA